MVSSAARSIRLTPSQLETNSFEESPDHETELRPSIGGWREMSACYVEIQLEVTFIAATVLPTYESP